MGKYGVIIDIQEERAIILQNSVPYHLKNIFTVTNFETDYCQGKPETHHISGDVVCECGCRRFTIRHNENCEYDTNLHYGLLISTTCTECGRTYTLFDEALHSYDGAVCGDYESAPENSLVGYKCGCGCDKFEISLTVEVMSRDFFTDEVVKADPDRFKTEDYINVLTWLLVRVGCDECGEAADWIDLELS